VSDRPHLVALAIFLTFVVLASAIGLVYTKHQTRKLFVELEQLRKEVVSLNTEWGQLQLEQSAWSDQSRVERIARERLGMVSPEAEQMAFIKP
jgi:cell division protein FtsL